MVGLAWFIKVYFSGTPVLNNKAMFDKLVVAWIVNVVGFFGLAMTFYYRYGFITDDIQYYNGCLNFVNPGFFKVNRANEFMFYISKPLRTIVGLDLPSFHILFATFGFIGSLIFYDVFYQRMPVGEEAFQERQNLGFWVILCFPNFLAWGRIYGKDSLMLFLAALFTLGSFKVLTKGGVTLFRIIGLILVPLYLMQIIRPHIAGVLGVAFLTSYILKIGNYRVSKEVKIEVLIKYYGPIILIGLTLIFGFLTLRKLVGPQKKITVTTIQEKVVDAARSGTYGGSATGLDAELEENPQLIFSPPVVAKKRQNNSHN